jgi:hypothetical protein
MVHRLPDRGGIDGRVTGTEGDPVQDPLGFRRSLVARQRNDRRRSEYGEEGGGKTHRGGTLGACRR